MNVKILWSIKRNKRDAKHGINYAVHEIDAPRTWKRDRKVKVQDPPLLDLSWNKQSLLLDPHVASKKNGSWLKENVSIKGGQLGMKEKVVA